MGDFYTISTSSIVADPTQAIRKQAILAHVTIFDLLTEYGIRFSDKVTQQILCPVHKDRTPSARVYADANRVYCFTCAKLWDVIALVQAKRGCTFGQALDWLDGHYVVPPASANLTDVLRAQTRTRAPAPPPAPLFEMAEGRIRRARERLGFVRYGKALIALDVVYVQATTRVITADQFEAQVQAILAYVDRRPREGL